MRNKKNLLLLFLFLHFNTNYAQPTKYQFEHIQVEEGLTDNTITSFYKDSNGLLWIGTQNGLNRVCGSKIEQLKHTSDNTSIGSNYIRSIYEDQDQNVWILTSSGVSKYIAEKDHFINYEIPTISRPKYVSGMCEDENQNLWIFRYNGDILQKRKNKNHFKIIHIKNKNLQFNHIKHTLQIGHNVIICSEYGIFILDLVNKTIINDDPILDKYNINTIIQSENKKCFWIATENRGVLKTDIEFNVIDSITTSMVLPNRRVRTIGIDQHKNLWIGTTKGLVIYNTINRQSQRIEENNINPYALSQNSIQTILIDRQLNQVWLGTIFGGVNLYHATNIPFYTMNPWISFQGVTSKGKIVNCIQEDNSQRIWLGTTDAGINVWNRKNQTLATVKKSNGLSSNNIKSLKVINDSIALIGTHSKGLNIYNYKRQEVIHLRSSENNDLKDDHIYDILLDHKKRIWIGTWNGLFQFNLEQNKLTPYISDCQGNHLTSEQISCLYQDKQRQIWIGTFKGLNIYNIQEQRFYQFTTDREKGNLSNNNITSIHQDREQQIWVGTHAGINLYNKTDQSFGIPPKLKKYQTSTIYSIISDENNNLWFSASEGIICYNTITKQLIQYNKEDGILNSLFRINCVAYTQNKEIVFGGNNGITIYNPLFKKHNQEINTDPLFIRKVVGYNKTKSDSTIYFNPKRNSTITFDSNCSEIEIYYNTINYRKAHRQKLQCKLEGKDQQWSNPSLKRISRYNNLKEQHYIFKIKREGISNTEFSINLAINQEESYLLFYILVTTILALTITTHIQKRSKIRNNFKQFSCKLFRKPEVSNINKINQQIQALEFCTESIGRKCRNNQNIRDDYDQLKRQILELKTCFSPSRSEINPKDLLINSTELTSCKNYDLTVLMLCDDNTIRNSYCHFLKDFFNIKECYNHLQAEKILTSNKIDSIIFYPIHTTKYENIGFCKQLKQNIKLFPIPLIYITPKKDEHLEMELLKKGVDDIISIPFTSALLQEKITNHSKRIHKLTDIYSSQNNEKRKNTPISKEHIFLQKITKIIENNYTKSDFSVDRFANITKMSRSNLHIKIKNITGNSTSNFIMKYRMQKALELIQKEQYTIVEISEQVGFNNANYFSKNFKKEFGVAPSEYLTNKNRYKS